MRVCVSRRSEGFFFSPCFSRGRETTEGRGEDPEAYDQRGVGPADGTTGTTGRQATKDAQYLSAHLSSAFIRVLYVYRDIREHTSLPVHLNIL